MSNHLGTYEIKDYTYKVNGEDRKGKAIYYYDIRGDFYSVEEYVGYVWDGYAQKTKG